LLCKISKLTNFLFCLKGDVWICMEVMDASLDKFYKKIYEMKGRIPEDVLRVIGFSVSNIIYCVASI